jgi:hypothetical protein
MPLYEVAITQKPSKKERDAGETEKLIFGPKAIVAMDEQAAAIGSVIEAQKNGGINIDPAKAEVMVRPFGE